MVPFGRRAFRVLLAVGVSALAACAGESPPGPPPDLPEFAAQYTEAWCSQDPARVAAFFAEDGALTINDGEPAVGRAAITADAEGFMSSFPDMVVEMDSLGFDGDRVTYHWTLTGTNSGPGGTGHPVRIRGFEAWRFGPDGLIQDSRGRFDTDEYGRQVAGSPPPPDWEYDSSLLFPADRSLVRPEDGVALPDGRLIVTDQAHGLRLVRADGSSEPFGGMVEAGYEHRPPTHPGGANGVSLEPGGTHLLVADVFGGGIYRVEIATGAAERVYRHRYGVNTAVRDSRGAIWFTQSARNTPEEGEPRMWAAVDVPRPEGALLRLDFADGRFAERAEVLVDSLYFANGVAIDEPAGHLYVAETVGGRVWRYDADLDAGRLSSPLVLLEGEGADNLELDGKGRLWVALPLTNELRAVYTSTGASYAAFRSVTPEQVSLIAEFARRAEAGESRLELFGPAVWAPLPGALTGVILDDRGPAYLTNLGDALVRLPR